MKAEAATGGTGAARDVNTAIEDGILVGNAGEPVTLKLELWAKEKDPRDRPRGV